MKLYITIFFTLFIGGCSSFIANKITSSNTLDISGNIAERIVLVDLCDNDFHCIKAQKIKDLEVDKMELSFNFKVNKNHKKWLFKLRNADVVNSNSDNNLIFIFSGYSQPSEIIYIHQQWLQYISGAEVIVIQSADKSDSFQFGLDYVSPIVSYIEKKKPNQVHLIGFSMGAVAAQAVSEKVDNPHLHLVAPMTNFEHSTIAIWDILHKEKFYSKFISQVDVEDAVQLVYEKSNVDVQDIDIMRRIKTTTVPTYVYASTDDRVTSASDWSDIQLSQLVLNTYNDLNHLEMMGLIHKPLLKDFVSNLLQTDIIETDIETLGILCDITDDKCLSKIERL